MKWNQDRYWKVWKKETLGPLKRMTIKKKSGLTYWKATTRDQKDIFALRTKILGKQLANVDEKFPGLPLSDNVIKSLDSISNNQTSWRNATNRGNLDIVYQDKYHRLINSDIWSNLFPNIENYSRLIKKNFPQK
ncbi:MAG: hypothetical protein IPJ51_20010 [Saprospiraceae bacterium]|nr:hypothetical protein [Saprospiraceae bacterium]